MTKLLLHDPDSPSELTVFAHPSAACVSFAFRDCVGTVGTVAVTRDGAVDIMTLLGCYLRATREPAGLGDREPRGVVQQGDES